MDSNALEITDKRLTELEIKSSYAEEALDSLNAVIVRQQGQIDLLLREVALLKERAPDEASGTFRSLRDDLPPHY